MLVNQPAGAFTTEHVAKLTGLSRRQIEYWDTTDVFSPSISRGGDRRPFGRIYSFADIVALRTLAKLRKRVSLATLRGLGAWLKQHYHQPWSSLRFYVAAYQIIFADPDTGVLISNNPLGQGVLPFELEPVAN